MSRGSTSHSSISSASCRGSHLLHVSLKRENRHVIHQSAAVRPVHSNQVVGGAYPPWDGLVQRWRTARSPSGGQMTSRTGTARRARGSARRTQHRQLEWWMTMASRRRRLYTGRTINQSALLVLLLQTELKYKLERISRCLM